MSIIPFGFWGGVNEITFTTGLKGARFVGYFADNVYWFNTATPHGDVQNNVTSISSFSSSADLYSWQWFGYFLAPETGVYTFYTASDDASYLWIGNNALGNNYTVGNALVNNGGLHAVVEKSGTVTLQADTYYALRIQFGENGGGDVMTVSFAGPNITKTTNGSGYYFGGEESYAGNWIGGVVPRFDEEESQPPSPTGLVTDQLILNLDAGDTNSYPGTGNTWFDLSGYSSAAITGNFASSWNSSGYFALLQATSYYADINLVGVNSTTPTLTVELWTKPYDTGASAGMLFGFSVYDFFRTNQGVGFNTAVTDLRGLTSGQLNNAKFYSNWHHIVCVMQQTTSYTNNKIYIDGTLIYNITQILGSEDVGNRSFSAGQMRINGWRNNDTYPYRQDIAIFRVYKKELSQEEVWQNYNAFRTRPLFNKPAIKNVVPDGCRVYFDMEGSLEWFGSSGSYVRDYSGYCFFGTLSGGAAWDSSFGGFMPLRAANGRYISVNRSATSTGFGLSYGSASFVMMVRNINHNNFEYIFGRPDVAPSYGNDVNIAFTGYDVRYSHNTASPPETFSTGPMASNVWYHIVCTYNYDTRVVQIYINGQLVIGNGYQERMTGTSGNSYALAYVNSIYYNYDFGLFMAYNRVISSSEVTTLYESQKTRFGIINNGIIRSNHIFYWDAGNSVSYPGSGTAINDLINNNYDGTLNNGVAYNSGDGGKWVLTKSSNHWINSSGTSTGVASVGSSDFTIEIWCKPVNINQQGFLLSNRNSSTGDRYSLHLGTVSSGANFTDSKKISIVFYQNSSGYGREFLVNDDIIDGSWKHIVVTRSGSVFLTYVNGVSKAMTTVRSLGSGTPTLSTGTTWRIGDSGAGTGSGGASIDSDVSIVRMYNRALPFSEIEVNYNEEKSRFGL